MPLVQDDRTVLNLIKLTSSGLSVASFIQIKDVLSEKFKEIYGSDIDLANTTADGIYVHNVALIISNILQAFNFLYTNLDIRTAQGTYLESLCALSGIYRQSATQSVAYMSITNNEETSITLQGGTSGTQLHFVDNAGIEWTTCVGDVTHSKATSQIVLEPGIAQSVPIYCTIYGPVQAKKGWISTLLTNEYDLSFTQIDDAEIGSNIESDAQLRQRRNENISSSGLTVTSNLRGAISKIGGVKNVKIYNNNTGNYLIALDGTIIQQGSVYVIINQSQVIDDELIGTVIYEKMTPGIKTSKSNEVCGINHSYTYDEENQVLANVVNWKECTKISSGLIINISLVKYNNFSLNEFCDNLVSYLNNLEIGQTFTTYELLSEMISENRTYVMNSIELQSDDLTIIDMTDYVQYNTKDTCFNLSNTPTIVETDNTLVITW